MPWKLLFLTRFFFQRTQAVYNNWHTHCIVTSRRLYIQSWLIITSTERKMLNGMWKWDREKIIYILDNTRYASILSIALA